MISIIMPTYNRAKFLPRAIKSILNQTYNDWELIIVDDGSTDNTKEVVKPYLSDSRIQYFKIKNQGASVARNYGFEKSHGELLTFLDSDDEYYPDKIEKQLNLFNTSKIDNLGVVSCGREDYRNEKKYFSWIPKYKGNILDKLLAKKRVGAGTPFLMIKKEVLNKGIRFDPKMPAGQDFDFLVQISQLYNFDFVAKPLVKVYHHNHERVYNSTNALKAYDLQFKKYKHLMTKKWVYSGYVIKHIDLYFVYGYKKKAMDKLKKEFNKLNYKKYLWFFYMQYFSNADNLPSRFFLKILRNI